jgi:two-component system, NarL family, nitrate/nitrite response regulator NarL
MPAGMSRGRRVLVVDDNAAVRTLVRQLFALEPDFEIAGEADNGREALEKASDLRPDIVILDLAMPVVNGLDAAPELRKIFPEIKIILFTVEQGSEVDRLASQAGINAVILKDNAPRLISQARLLLEPEEDEADSGELRNAS